MTRRLCIAQEWCRVTLVNKLLYLSLWFKFINLLQALSYTLKNPALLEVENLKPLPFSKIVEVVEYVFDNIPSSSYEPRRTIWMLQPDDGEFCR